jgi:aspartate aminotransferase-like enzyme
MSQVIIFPQSNNSVAMIFPTGELSIEETAKKDTPKGKPYLIIDRGDLPSGWNEFFNALEADFTNPDGYGE